ncbi:MAG: hypothetical protein QNJ88_16325 [Acidimicrobiia bacterium]|nr:hypothetical protein [Acidimicrobiia bacterium]
MSPQLVEYSEEDPGCMSGIAVPFLFVIAALLARWRRSRRT